MKDIFNPGLFDPRINEGKELAIMEKYNPYSGIKVQFWFSPDDNFFKTIFRIAQKGVVIQGGNDDCSDLCIPWNDIAGVSTYESFWSPLTLVINLKDGRDGYIFFDNWSTTNTHIHLIRGISRIILDKIDEESE